MSNVVPAPKLTRKDFESDQDVRWCPGCGDYSILANVQRVMPELGVPREKLVFVSGIGCSSRFPYYMNTYGFHTIHGRAPAVAMGIKAANPDLTVWLVTGDGDGLSIGGNHLMHCLRRNVDLNILLFNNRIYGLTKGQYSPTSEFGKITKSSPTGSVDFPVDPSTFAIGCSASFVARSIDVDATHLTEMLRRTAAHKGASFLEIYQNCNVFNDKAFAALTGREEREVNRINLTHGEKVVFGPDGSRGVVIEGGSARIVEVAEVGIDAVHVHDAHADDPAAAYALSRLSHGPFGPTPVGIFRSKERPVYEDTLQGQIHDAQARKGPGDLAALIASAGTWTVG